MNSETLLGQYLNTQRAAHIVQVTGTHKVTFLAMDLIQLFLS